MKFIKLINAQDDSAVYVNADRIDFVANATNYESRIYNANAQITMNRNVVTVKESVAEVIALCEGNGEVNDEVPEV